MLNLHYSKTNITSLTSLNNFFIRDAFTREWSKQFIYLFIRDAFTGERAAPFKLQR